MVYVYIFEFTDRPNTSIASEDFSGALERLAISFGMSADELRKTIIGVSRAPARAFATIDF